MVQAAAVPRAPVSSKCHRRPPRGSGRGGRALRLRGGGHLPASRPRTDPVDRRRHRSSESLMGRSRRAGAVNRPAIGRRSPARRPAANPRDPPPAQSPRRFRAAIVRERVGESRRHRPERGRRAPRGCPARADSPRRASHRRPWPSRACSVELATALLVTASLPARGLREDTTVRLSRREHVTRSMRPAPEPMQFLQRASSHGLCWPRELRAS
jgi:hypothetical protein